MRGGHARRSRSRASGWPAPWAPCATGAPKRSIPQPRVLRVGKLRGEPDHVSQTKQSIEYVRPLAPIECLGPMNRGSRMLSPVSSNASRTAASLLDSSMWRCPPGKHHWLGNSRSLAKRRSRKVVWRRASMMPTIAEGVVASPAICHQRFGMPDAASSGLGNAGETIAPIPQSQDRWPRSCLAHIPLAGTEGPRPGGQPCLSSPRPCTTVG